LNAIIALPIVTKKRSSMVIVERNKLRELLEDVVKHKTEEIALLSQTNFFHSLRKQIQENGDQPPFLYPKVMDIKKYVDQMKKNIPIILLIDFDGTIAETEMMVFKATNMMLEKNGFPFQWTFGEYCKLLLTGNTEARLTHYFNQKGCWPKDLTTIKERVSYVKQLKEHKDICFDLLVKEDGGTNFHSRPGIFNLMEETIIKLKGKCCIVSNTATTTVKKLFEILVLNHDKKDHNKSANHYRFLLDSVHIIGGDAVAANKRKPAPDLYIKALKEMNCNDSYNYYNVVVIEDSNDGLQAAINANIRNVIITKTNFTKFQNFKGANLILEEFPDDFSLESYMKYCAEYSTRIMLIEDKLIAKALLRFTSNKSLSKKIASIYTFTEEEQSILMEGCYSEIDEFVIIGCPKSTDLDIVVFVEEQYQNNGQIQPLSPESLRMLKSRLVDIGADVGKELDVCLICVNNEGRVIAFSKGGQETVLILWSTWKYHPQEFAETGDGEEKLPKAFVKYNFKQLTYEECHKVVFFQNKVVDLASWVLKRLKQFVRPENYQKIREQKNAVFSMPSEFAMYFFHRISPQMIIHPSCVGADLDIITWRSGMKSITMKLIQIVVWHHHRATCYTKSELANRWIPRIFSNLNRNSDTNDAKYQKEEGEIPVLVQEALYYLLRGTEGALPPNPTLFSKLMKCYIEIVDKITKDTSKKYVIKHFESFCNDSLPKELLPCWKLFMKSPVKSCELFEKKWLELEKEGFDPMSFFEMKSVEADTFRSVASTRIKNNDTLTELIENHFIFLHQRSNEWKELLKFYKCGKNSGSIAKTFQGKYNLIRGNFIEMMVQHYITDIFSHLGINDIYVFSLGLVVENVGVKGCRGAAPDLLAITTNGILYTVEIKGLKSRRVNSDFNRGIELARKQVKTVETILGGKKLIEIRKLIILGTVEEEKVFLRLYQNDIL